jgi:hypothetical protein
MVAMMVRPSPASAFRFFMTPNADALSRPLRTYRCQDTYTHVDVSTAACMDEKDDEADKDGDDTSRARSPGRLVENDERCPKHKIK